MSALTFSHLSSDSFEKESQLKAGRKRPRIREAISCSACRSRKIRCDREHPCSPCVERGAGAKCTYGQAKAPSAGRVAEPAAPTASNTSPGRAAIQKPSPTSRPDVQPVTTSDIWLTTPFATPGLHDGRRTLLTPTSQPLQNHCFQGSSRKTRFVGVSHWMAPCNEMMVIKALISRSAGFQASLKRFSEVKEWLRRTNAVSFNIPHSAIATDGRLSPSILFSALPDRSVCEHWIRRFLKSYNRVYGIVDAATLASDLQRAISAPTAKQQGYATAVNSVYLLRIIATVALGMQLSDPDRLRGRRLGHLVEQFVQRAARVQKPCIGSVQVLVLLALLKTVSASDSDGEHDIAGVLGLASHIVSSMGLHRDPTLFGGMPAYYTEQRKRLWACFVRLHLAYCIRTGKQLSLRFEDTDCPLPNPEVLEIPAELRHGLEGYAKELAPDEAGAQSDAVFAYAAAKLANAVAPVHQTLCSVRQHVSAEQQAALQGALAALAAELPSCLQPGTATTDPVLELQRTMLSVGMHSFLLVMSLSLVFSATNTTSTRVTGEHAMTDAYLSQRPQLLEIWDYTVSILSQFQNICYRGASTMASSPNPTGSSWCPTRLDTDDASIMANHLMWTDTARAALAGCLVVGRLRRQELGRVVPFSMRPQQQHTTSIFKTMLSQRLSALLQMWRSRYHLGPVTAKTSLLLAVTVAVTANLDTNFGAIFDQGVAAADRLVGEMEKSRKQHSLQTMPAGIDLVDTPDSATTNTSMGIAAAGQYISVGSTASIPSTAATDMLRVSSPDDVHSLASPFSWPPMTSLKNDVPSRLPDLSTTSSTASQTTTPDFGEGGASSSGNSEFHILDFPADVDFPFDLSNNYGPDCPLFGNMDTGFVDFSAGQGMNTM